MIHPDQRTLVERHFRHMAPLILADFDVVDEIAKRLKQHPERDPLGEPSVRVLASTALALWIESGRQAGEQPDDYLRRLVPIHPRLVRALTRRGYWPPRQADRTATPPDNID